MLHPDIPLTYHPQLTGVCEMLKENLRDQLLAIHLFGSCVESGLKPKSDLDLMVTITGKLSAEKRSKLMLELLKHSTPVTSIKVVRPLEVTVISTGEVIPWRHPAIREMQFGEWLRDDILNGMIEDAVIDADLTLLLKKIRAHSWALYGPPADEILDPVPDNDFYQALYDTLKLWNVPEDWTGDEQSVVLAIARIWFSVATTEMTSKETAAGWLLERLPQEHHPILNEALDAYLSGRKHELDERAPEVMNFILFAKSAILSLKSPC